MQNIETKNKFDEIIEKMITENITGIDDSLYNLEHTEKISKVFKTVDSTGSFSNLDLSRKPKMEHLKSVITMLKDYVKVGEVKKKEAGEVMTPLDLVKLLLSDLENGVWSNPNLKWLDSCNGSGPFLVMVIYKLMVGLKDWESDEEKRYKHIVENMIYAGELQPKNMFLFVSAIDPFNEYNLNIYTGSFLEKEFDIHMKNVWNIEKFDIMVGNPPYQNGKDSNFYVKFIDKFYQISKEGSTLLYVVPNRFFQPSHKAHKAIVKSDIKIVYHNLNDYFQGISTHIGSFLIENKKPINSEVLCVFKNEKSIIDINSPLPTDIRMSSIVYKNLLDKIINNSDKVEFSKTKSDLYIKRQWKRWNSITEIGGDHVFNIVVSDYNLERDGKDGRWVKCDDLKKMEWYLSKSNIIRFLTKMFASAMNVPPFVWTIIPNIDLSNINDNKDLYEFFNLTNEEIKIIEENLR